MGNLKITDEWGYNTPEFNKALAINLSNFIISMTNGETHYDVAFSIVQPYNHKPRVYQSGISTQERTLMVSINLRSCFAFSLEKEKYSFYVAEKLGISKGDQEIAEQICDIINIFVRKFKYD